MKLLLDTASELEKGALITLDLPAPAYSTVAFGLGHVSIVGRPAAKRNCSSVNLDGRPTLVCSAAGCGKTKTLWHRIGHLWSLPSELVEKSFGRK